MQIYFRVPKHKFILHFISFIPISATLLRIADHVKIYEYLNGEIIRQIFFHSENSYLIPYKVKFILMRYLKEIYNKISMVLRLTKLIMKMFERLNGMNPALEFTLEIKEDGKSHC